MNILEQIEQVKKSSRKIALLSENQRDKVLLSLARELRNSSDEIIAENARDLAEMAADSPLYDRLLLNQQHIENIAAEIETVASLPSVIGKTLEHKNMPNGLIIDKISVPFGVVAVIYESRPNVTVDVFSLCFKSGNACVLKGGKEARCSNEILAKIIRRVLTRYDVDQNIVYLMPIGRENSSILLEAVGLVDVCIPRGGQSLIEFVRNNSKIPVIETGAGIVHIYFDAEGDLEKGAKIIDNAKTRKVSVCNALDCLLVHKSRLNDLSALIEPLQKSRVEIYADEDAYAELERRYQYLLRASDEDFGREFLSLKLSIKIVDSMDSAVEHISRYTSGHSEAIITENASAAKSFVDKIDAAVVYINASTAFTDGAQFGMGAEIGISTQKLHARGPMALEALTTYKWIVKGTGNVR
jgi:glutamate-5-semialdehyde dehydrogenase